MRPLHFILPLSMAMVSCVTSSKQQAREALERDGLDYENQTDFLKTVGSGDKKAFENFFLSYDGWPCDRWVMNARWGYCNEYQQAGLLKNLLGQPSLLDIIANYPIDKFAAERFETDLYWYLAKGNCNTPSLIKFIEKRGKEFTGKSILRGAIEGWCGEETKMVLKVYPHLAVEATKTMTQRLSNVVDDLKNKTIVDTQEINAILWQRVSASTEIVNSHAKAVCKDGKKEVCIAQVALGKVQQQYLGEYGRVRSASLANHERTIQGQKVQADFENEAKGPTGVARMICAQLDFIKFNQSQNDDENDAAKISGYINKKRLYEAGQGISMARKYLAELRSQYQEKADGKTFKDKDCLTPTH